MKKILIAALSLVTLVSCGGGEKQMYFDNDLSRVYNDATAEFDTLSYAVGMNVGLGLSLQNAYLELQPEAIIASIDAVLSQPTADYDIITENGKLMKRYAQELSRPYMMAKRMQAFAKTDKPDTMTLPAVYNEEFTREKVTEMYGRDIASYIMRLALPVNTYWVYKAIEESDAIENVEEIDAKMPLKGNDVRNVMSKYAKEQWAVYNRERTAAWLKDIAAKEDVHMMVVEDDTLYYRVDVAGHGARPQNILDTVSFSYEVYTRAGRPVESTAKRLESLNDHLEMTRTKMLFADSMQRAMQIKQIEEQIENVKNLRIPLSNSMIKGAQYAMKHVSEGGEITFWMPAALAYGERGNREVGPNDGIVMSVKLNSVTTVDPEAVAEAEETLKAGESKVKVIPTSRPVDFKKPIGKKPVIMPSKPAQPEQK